jgi:hypothetical protein
MLSLKDDTNTMEDLRNMSNSDFIKLVEGMIGITGKGISEFMFNWNDENADRKEMANNLNEVMHEPMEYMTLATMLLKVHVLEPDMKYDQVMRISFDLLDNFESILTDDEFKKELRRLKNEFTKH